MKKLLASIFGLALILGAVLSPHPARAQAANCGVNYVPVIGVNCDNIRKNSYTAVLLSLVPAASATDFFCISGSSSRTVTLRRIELSGTAGTLVTTPIVLVHRVSLDTGTAAAATYVKTGGQLNSLNPAATATVVGYNTTGGNPTIVDTSPTYIRNSVVTLGVSGTTAAPADRLVWNFGTQTDAYSQGLSIPSGATAQQYCLNLNAVSVSSGVIAASMEWTEQ